MTKRMPEHHDQTVSKRDRDARPAAGGDRPKGREEQRALPAARAPQDRRQPANTLGIGAPLTAAFIGGFLVIENLAGADQPEGSGSSARQPDLLLGGNEGEDDALAAGRAGASGQRDADEAETAEAGSSADDPAAAPSEQAGLRTDGGEIDATPVMPAIAAAGETVMPAEEAAGGSISANLNILNVNLGGEEVSGAVEPIVEDEVLRRDSLVGTPGDDVLVGGEGNDSISGGSGDDIIFGNGGRDLLNGNEGNDQLFGGAGNDDLRGGAGDDLLDGGEDYDDLIGGIGNDVLIINNVHDVALDYSHAANSGNDTLVVRQGYADELIELTGIDRSTFFFSEHLDLRTTLPNGYAAKTQQVAGGIENVTLEGMANHDIFADAEDNRLTGNGGDNRIFGDEGDDRLSGRAGNDRLEGGGGDDELFGGSGDDILEGGLGEDMLYGDGGDDLFIFGLSDSAIDTAFDHSGANRIKLEGVSDQTVKTALLDDDLYITVDDTPIARIQDYASHEAAFEGIDFGRGLRSIDSLMTERQDLAAAVEEAEARAAEAAGDDLLAAHLHIIAPTLEGAPRTDERLDGTDADDWLSGFDGKDLLFGKHGNDNLEGGDGSDDLRGGAGDDRYLFSRGEQGSDKITDSEGRNLAEIKGYSRADIDGAMLGGDLAVLAKGNIIFRVEDYASNPESFEGVQVGNRFVHTEDLLA